jgi:NifU-like protein involved in Fe-S cluster formation
VFLSSFLFIFLDSMSLWSEEQTALLLQTYSAHPVNNYPMDDYTVKYEIHNALCGDWLILYVRLVHDTIRDTPCIEEISYTWHPSMFTIVAASLLAEMVPWKTVNEVMQWTFATVKSWWYIPSPKRQRSAVTPLLALRNALHEYRGDLDVDTYDTLLPLS